MRHFVQFRAAFVAAGLVLLPLGTGAALAQDVPVDTVVATIDGVPITERDLALAYQDFGSTLSQISSGSCSTQPGCGKCWRISR